MPLLIEIEPIAVCSDYLHIFFPIECNDCVFTDPVQLASKKN